MENGNFDFSNNIAIISDIHSNIEALTAVLRDIRSRNITEILCLGDIIGYGPNPRECLDIAMKFNFNLMGNHDEAALFTESEQRFNYKAKAAIQWTRQILENSADYRRNQERWNFLGERPKTYNNNGILLVHGSPLNPVREYIFPDIVNRPERFNQIFEKINHVCFIGHTHIPGIVTEDMEFFEPQSIPDGFVINHRKTLVNVGSVGQPRDGDSRACYVTVENMVIHYHRVEYDFYKTMDKIYTTEALSHDLADRLAEGR